MSFDFTPKGLLSIKHLRLRYLWIGIGLLMLLTVAVASLVSIPSSVKSIVLHDKVLHTLAYACLMGWFAQIYRHDLTRLILVVGLSLMGIAIEFAQGMVPDRQFDILDMVANTSGVALSWALAYTRLGNVLAWIEDLLCRKVLRA